MRVLINESLPVELADELPFENTSTVRQQGWLGLRNGVLLRAAVAAGFTTIVTADGALKYQQNLKKIGIAAIVTHPNRAGITIGVLLIVVAHPFVILGLQLVRRWLTDHH